MNSLYESLNACSHAMKNPIFIKNLTLVVILIYLLIYLESCEMLLNVLRLYCIKLEIELEFIEKKTIDVPQSQIQKKNKPFKKQP